MSANFLPDELWAIVVKKLVSQSSSRKQVALRHDLASIRLTSSQIGNAATPYLFNSISTSSDTAKSSAIATSQLNGYVRRLGINFSADMFGDRTVPEIERVFARERYKRQLEMIIRNLPRLQVLIVGSTIGTGAGQRRSLEYRQVFNLGKFVSRMLAEQENLGRLIEFDTRQMPTASIFRQDVTGRWPVLSRLSSIRIQIGFTQQRPGFQYIDQVNSTMKQLTCVKSIRLKGISVAAPHLMIPLALSECPTKVLSHLSLTRINIVASDLITLLRANQAHLKYLSITQATVTSGTWEDIFAQICKIPNLKVLSCASLTYGRFSQETALYRLQKDLTKAEFLFNHIPFPIEFDFESNRFLDMHALGDLIRFARANRVGFHSPDYRFNNRTGSKYGLLLPLADVQGHPSRLGRREDGKRYVMCRPVHGRRHTAILQALQN